MIILQVKYCFSFSSAVCECSCSVKFLNNALQVLCCPTSMLSTNNVLALWQELNFICICKNIKTKHTQSQQMSEQINWVLRGSEKLFLSPFHIMDTLHCCLISPFIAPSLIPSGPQLIPSSLWVPRTTLAYNCRGSLKNEDWKVNMQWTVVPCASGATLLHTFLLILRCCKSSLIEKPREFFQGDSKITAPVYW